MDNTETTKSDDLFLVWYEEGRYTQRRFLVKGEENARKTVERLNEEYDVSEEDQENGGDEVWYYEPIDLKNPYLLNT